MSQAEIAKALGLSPASMTKMKRAGCPMGTADEVRAWRARNIGPYIKPGASYTPAPPPSLAEAGSAPAPSGLSLAEERALLAREQRIGFELKNALARGEYAPISLLSEVLAQASVAVVSHLDQLPGRIKRACPLLPARALDEVAATVAAARNEWVRQTCELSIAQLETAEDDEGATSD